MGVVYVARGGEEREREISLGVWLRMTKDHFKEVEKEENRP